MRAAFVEIPNKTNLCRDNTRTSNNLRQTIESKLCELIATAIQREAFFVLFVKIDTNRHSHSDRRPVNDQ